jgi:hypothetical protein
MNIGKRGVLWVLGVAAITVAPATGPVAAQTAAPAAPTAPAAPAAENTFQLKSGKRVERVGNQLFLLDEAGKRTLAKDGTYPLKDGRQFVVRNGKIATFGPLSKTAPKGGIGPTGGFPSDQTTLKNAQTTEVDKHTTTVPSTGNRPGITQENQVKGKVLTPPQSPAQSP